MFKGFILAVVLAAAAALGGGGDKAQAACSTTNPDCDNVTCVTVYYTYYSPYAKGLQVGSYESCTPGRF